MGSPGRGGSGTVGGSGGSFGRPGVSSCAASIDAGPFMIFSVGISGTVVQSACHAMGRRFDHGQQVLSVDCAYAQCGARAYNGQTRGMTRVAVTAITIDSGNPSRQ